MFGKKLSEYVSFSKGFLALVVFVGLLRLALSLAGGSVASVRFVSLTAVLVLGALYLGARVHTSGFGSYRQLLPLVGLAAVVSQLIVIAGIAIAIATGTHNIFSVPEYSPPAGGQTAFHVIGHGVAAVVGSFILWAFGSIAMAVTKRLTAPGTAATAS